MLKWCDFYRLVWKNVLCPHGAVSLPSPGVISEAAISSQAPRSTPSCSLSLFSKMGGTKKKILSPISSNLSKGLLISKVISVN